MAFMLPFLALVLGVRLLSAAPTQIPPRPNIILLLVDDMGLIRLFKGWAARPDIDVPAEAAPKPGRP
jgi:hypothetical protein